MSHSGPQETIAIIGAGLSGLSCATELQAQGFKVQVFEKSRGPSGRMSTRNGKDWTADHGAQYFTARDPLFIEELNNWINAGISAAWHPHIKVFENGQWHERASTEKRYVGIPAMNSPGKHLAENLPMHFNQTIDQIDRQDGQWVIHSLESGNIKQQFDWLVLALPAVQTFTLSNLVDKSVEKADAQFKMMGCWTVIASFAEKLNMPFDAAFINDEIIGWICRNNSKPARQGLETWTIHANPQWSQQSIELEKEEAGKRLLECAKRLGLDCQNAQISLHRWRYASGSIDAKPGFRAYQHLKLGLCGDWLHGGRVEGAWLSGYQLALQIKNE